MSKNHIDTIDNYHTNDDNTNYNDVQITSSISSIPSTYVPTVRIYFCPDPEQMAAFFIAPSWSGYRRLRKLDPQFNRKIIFSSGSEGWVKVTTGHWS